MGETPTHEELVRRLERAESALAAMRSGQADIGAMVVRLEAAEERERHLNAVLRAVCNVNQCISEEDDPERLIQGVCENLAGTPGYGCAWIALVDENGGVTATAGSGFDGAFAALAERLRGGQWPRCAREALAAPGVFVTREPAVDCGDCPLVAVDAGRAGLSARLEYQARVYGVLAVSVPALYAEDEEERGLVAELASDIASALYWIEAEQRLRLQAAILSQVQDLVTLTDLEGRIIYVNEAVEKLLKRTADELTGQTIEVYGEDAERGATQREIIERTRTEGEWRGEVVDTASDGAEIVLDFRTWLMRDEGGEPQYLCGVARDISERKRVEQALYQMKWLLEKEQVKDVGAEADYAPAYGDVTELNTEPLIRDSVGQAALREIAGDIVHMLDTSLAIYERNGDYAFGMFVSGWCRLLDLSSRALCHTDDNREALDCGRWLCHENCWNDSAKAAMNVGEPTDIECVGGIRLYAVPIRAGDEIVGAINIGYGNPPTDAAEVARLAEEFHVNPEELADEALAYRPRPPFIVNLAKRRLRSAAKLIGEIVERKRAENTLRESEERFRELFNNMSSGVAIYEVMGDGEDFVFKDLNPAGARIGQVRREDAIGRSVLDVFPGARQMGVFDVFRRVYRSGKPEVHPTSFYEDERVAHWVENYVYKLPSGEIVAVYDDVTKRKQAEEALGDRQTELEQIFEAIPDAIVYADPERRITKVNAAFTRLYGYEPEGVLGKKTRMLYVADEAFGEQGRLRYNANARDVCDVYEIRYRKKNGEVFLSETIGTPVRDASDNVIGMIGIVRDITERRRQEKELARHRDHLEELVEERTRELRIMVNSMAGREVRMAGLKKAIKALRAQVEEAGMEPVAGDPLLEGDENG